MVFRSGLMPHHAYSGVSINRFAYFLPKDNDVINLREHGKVSAERERSLRNRARSRKMEF